MGRTGRSCNSSRSPSLSGSPDRAACSSMRLKTNPRAKSRSVISWTMRSLRGFLCLNTFGFGLSSRRIGTRGLQRSRSFLLQQIPLERLRNQLLELLHAGKLVHIFQSEAEKKFLRGLVENGAADNVFAAGGRDQLAIEQGGDDAARIHAANLADLRYG